MGTVATILLGLIYLKMPSETPAQIKEREKQRHEEIIREIDEQQKRNEERRREDGKWGEQIYDFFHKDEMKEVKNDKRNIK